MRQQSDVILLQEGLCSVGSMGPCVVLLKQVLWMPLEKGHDVRPEHLVDVSGGIDSMTTSVTHVLEDHRSNTLIQAYSPLYHDAFTAPSVPFGDVGLCEAFPQSSPDADAAIAWVDAKPAFVTEEDPPPLTIAPVHVVQCPQQAVLAMLNCQGWSLRWTPAMDTHCHQSAPHGPIADLSAMVTHSVSGCVGSSLVRIP